LRFESRTERAFRAALLACVPFDFTLYLDPSAVDQPMRRAVRTAIGDVELYGHPATNEDTDVGVCPVQAGHPQLALESPGRLPKRLAEEHLRLQASLDCYFVVVWLLAALVGRHALPYHTRVKPNRQQTSVAERFVWIDNGLLT
jgi:hypothetical protein